MSKPSLWRASIQHEDGKIYLSVIAEKHGKIHRELEVYREYDDGKCECRNIYTSTYNGRIVLFPGEKLSYYLGGGIAEEEEWGECNQITLSFGENISEAERLLIESVYPVFGKYVINKSPDRNIYTIIRLLHVWIEHPESEHLIAAGYTWCALNKSFWKLSEKKRNQICLFMRQHPGRNYLLRDIQLMISRNITEEQVRKYRQSEFKRWTYDTYLYLCKQAENDSQWHVMNMYEDYLKMLKNSAHNIKEDYWKFPSNLYEAHNKLVEEEKSRRAAARRQYEIEFRKRAESWPCLEINGFTIFSTSDINEWEIQAHELHQCIVSARYDDRMAKGGGDIIFIRKNGRPIATAQVFGYKKIGQFYADEHSGTPGGSLPPDEVRAAFDEYMAQAKAWRKAKRARRAA